MAKITQDDLNKLLWSAADSARGTVDAGVFKDYVLALLFYKYMSDMHKIERAKLVERYGDDKERIEMRLKNARFVMPDGASFYDVYAQQSADNIGEILNVALQQIEDANDEKLHDIFTVDFNSQAILGVSSLLLTVSKYISSDAITASLFGLFALFENRFELHKRINNK